MSGPVTLRVSGVVCGGCMEVVDDALTSVDGVSSTRWGELETSPEVHVLIEASSASSEALVAAVKSTGRDCEVVEMGALARTVRLRVGGMTCGHCSSHIEKVLAAMEGVTSATVDLASAQATVVGTASADALVAAVEAAGKMAELVEEMTHTSTVRAKPAKEPAAINLKVGGMSCGHCSSRVEKALAAVEGVTSATVDLAAAQATVVGTAAADALVAAVEVTGKTAEVVEAPGRTHATMARGETDGADARTVRLRVGGMSCGHCSSKVEKALAAVEGVTSATVDLAAAQATVVGTAAAAALVAAVEAAGHSAELAQGARVTLAVDGMVCEGCRATVKRAHSRCMNQTDVKAPYPFVDAPFIHH